VHSSTTKKYLPLLWYHVRVVRVRARFCDICRIMLAFRMEVVAFFPLSCSHTKLFFWLTHIVGTPVFAQCTHTRTSSWKKNKIKFARKWKHYFPKRKIKLELLGKQIYNFLINAWNDWHIPISRLFH